MTAFFDDFTEFLQKDYLIFWRLRDFYIVFNIFTYSWKRFKKWKFDLTQAAAGNAVGAPQCFLKS